MTDKSPEAREQELAEEAARLVGDTIRSNPALVQAIHDGIAAAERGEGVPWREVAAEWPNRQVKRI